MTEKKSDELLVEEFKEGNLSAFESLFQKYKTAIFNLSFRMMGNYEEAEDITQDIFVKSFQNLHKFRGDASFKTWIYKIGSTTCIDALRRKKSLWGILRKITEVQKKSDENTGSYDEKTWVQETLKKLPENQKLLLVLRYIQGFSNKEIAQILNCSEGSLKVKLYRARESFKKKAGIYLKGGGENEV